MAQEFRAKFAAARLCTPKAALAAVLARLHQDQRSRQAAIAGRALMLRDARTAEKLARHYRQAAERVALGPPQPKRPVTLDMAQERIKAAILRNRPG